eukprot:3409745-Prymnesium_polylepis.1
MYRHKLTTAVQRKAVQATSYILQLGMRPDFLATQDVHYKCAKPDLRVPPLSSAPALATAATPRALPSAMASTRPRQAARIPSLARLL